MKGKEEGKMKGKEYGIKSIDMHWVLIKYFENDFGDTAWKQVRQRQPEIPI